MFPNSHLNSLDSRRESELLIGLDEAIANMRQEPYGLIGFGGGEHTCIGMKFGKMEMKIVLAKLLKEYDWVVNPNYAEISPISVPPRWENKFRAVFKPLNNLKHN